MAAPRRHGKTLLLLAAGLSGQAIAQLLGIHSNSTYANLQAFPRQGLAALQQERGIGAPARISNAQAMEICPLPQLPPMALALPSISRAVAV